LTLSERKILLGLFVAHPPAMRVAPLLRWQRIAYGVTFMVFSLKELRHERAGPSKISPLECPVKFFF